MADLYSQYASGTQFTAGAIAGSALGASGLNPIVDRLNTITPGIISFPGNRFLALGNNIGSTSSDDNGAIVSQKDNTQLFMETPIVNSGTLTSIHLFGNAGASDLYYDLKQVDISANTSFTMATGSINKEETTIGSALINAGSFAYYIVTFANFDNTDEIYGGKVVYSL